MLENDEMDLGVSVFPDGPSWQRREQLASMSYRCIYNADRLGTGSSLTLDEYLAYPHLLTPTQGDSRGAVDNELGGRHKRRTVIYTTSRFAALPLILQRAAVIAIVPEQSALYWERTFGLTSSPVPVRMPPLTVSMIWHAKREGDAGLQWLRGVVRDVVESRMTEMPASAAVRKRRRLRVRSLHP